MNLRIRPETAHDREAIRKVNEAAFTGDAEAILVDDLRDGGFVEVSLVAELDNLIVGHILFSRVTVVGTEGMVNAVSLAPMAVRPDHQGQGIGGQLVEAGLEACRAKQQEVVLVLGHPDFYPRFGFSAELARPMNNPFGSGNAWMARELVPGALADVAGRIEYPAPYLRLESQ